LDELGRGTSTYDGLSLAWAVSESLAHLGARTLFATHYFELTHLSKMIPTLHNFRLSVKEWEGKIHFLHKVEEGAANRSYGLHVAALAGIPKHVVERAKILLEGFEEKSITQKSDQKKESQTISAHIKNVHSTNEQLHLPLTVAPILKHEHQGVINALSAMDINNLTPLQAFQFILDWKENVS
jgi:DNA mismatch repair protein MutS